MPAVARYLIDNDPEIVTTLESFLDVNECLSPEDIAAVTALAPGETYTAGGGGGAEWSLTRIDVEGSPAVALFDALESCDDDLSNEPPPFDERPEPTDEEIDRAADRMAAHEVSL